MNRKGRKIVNSGDTAPLVTKPEVEPEDLSVSHNQMTDLLKLFIVVGRTCKTVYREYD